MAARRPEYADAPELDVAKGLGAMCPFELSLLKRLKGCLPC